VEATLLRLLELSDRVAQRRILREEVALDSRNIVKALLNVLDMLSKAPVSSLQPNLQNGADKMEHLLGWHLSAKRNLKNDIFKT